MKKIFLSAVLILGVLISAAAFDDADLNLVTFANLTGQVIEYIFLSPADSDSWGPEILGSERTLEAGGTLGFYILYPDECGSFDIMAIGEDGGTFTMYEYEVCDGMEELIEFVRKDLIGDVPEMEFVTVYIRNDALPVWYLFISPADSDAWGVDYLDEVTILDSGETVSFLFPLADGMAEYDLMAIDEDGDEYRFGFDVDAEAAEGLFIIEMSDMVYE